MECGLFIVARFDFVDCRLERAVDRSERVWHSGRVQGGLAGTSRFRTAVDGSTKRIGLLVTQRQVANVRNARVGRKPSLARATLPSPRPRLPLLPRAFPRPLNTHSGNRSPHSVLPLSAALAPSPARRAPPPDRWTPWASLPTSCVAASLSSTSESTSFSWSSS